MKIIPYTLLLLFSTTLKAQITNTIQYDNQTFELCDKERVTKLWFDIVDIGVYYKDCASAENIFDQKSKLLRFSYLREVKGKQFTEGAIEYLEANLSPNRKSLCSASFANLNNAYQTVGNGDVYDLYILKDEGIKLYLNKKHLHTMPNTECRLDYLNVWFGEETMDSQFHALAKRINNSEANQ
ncbi:chalcone isomerase family protein [Kangiella spongicola]|uniref:Chalcone isomerase domain-containing protein n=1 Tax=Kangiella spongicola TaxID=796379 RepID=A0A318D5F5_9GAMM|nr:chalcone isomerase family protein [Kangiella spongicola]PXF64093.1 hypothetical protein DL796_02845 [Kangiella spongicola]